MRYEMKTDLWERNRRRVAGAALLLAMCVSGCGQNTAGTAGASAGETAVAGETVASGRTDGTSAGLSSGTGTEEAFTDELIVEVIDDSPAEDVPGASVIEGVRTLSLYFFDRNAGARTKVVTMTRPWTAGQDIASFEAYATDVGSFPLSAGAGQPLMDAWNGYWDAFDGAAGCKIGYRITFSLDDGTQIDATILHPDDVLPYRDYLENYLYDDVHQTPGAWYSHLEPADMHEDTVITSIKCTAGQQVDRIASPILLTAFVYNGDQDFSPDGTYIGDVWYTIELTRE